MGWTEERVRLLREMWAQGLSASQIAHRLGGVTRNAVIGKAHRLGLEGRPSPIKGTPGAPRPRPRAAAKRALAEREAAAAPAIAKTPMPAEQPAASRPIAPPAPPRQAKPGEGPACLWPLGDPGDADFHFCDALAVPGRPYCAEHCAVAYIRKDKSAA